MKVLFQDYTFNAAAQQITFNTSDIVNLEQILLITNVTDNVIVYNFANPLLGGDVTNNVLTLNYNTTSMSDTDSLQIFLDLQGAPSSEEQQVIEIEQLKSLKRMVKLLESNAVVDSNQRQRIALDASTATLSANVGTVTTVNQIAGVTILEAYLIMTRNSYANAIRSKLDFS